MASFVHYIEPQQNSNGKEPTKYKVLTTLVKRIQQHMKLCCVMRACLMLIFRLATFAH